MKKLFIGHAHEDKDSFVNELAEDLKNKFDVWYDDDRIVMGSSLFDEINKGISECDYGIVILSPNFFIKKWTNEELKGLFAKESKDKKVILPVWKDVDVADVQLKYPILADRKASMAKDGVGKVVNDIVWAIDFFEEGRSSEKSAEGFNKLRDTLQNRKEKLRSEEILRSPEGVQIVRVASHRTVEYFNIKAEELKSAEFGPIKVDAPAYGDYNSKATFQIGRIYLHAEYINDVSNSAFDSRMVMQIGRSERFSASNVITEGVYAPYITLENAVFWKYENKTELYSPEQLVDLWHKKYAESIANE